ncbi:MAG: peptide ABC transporter permease, partial [Roseiarcus sp.]
MANFSIPASSDGAEDAARLLQRLGFVVLALGSPCAEALSPRAIFLFFPIGVALLLVAAMLNPAKGVAALLRGALWSPLGRVSLALVAWAALSLAWTPFPIEASGHLLKLAATALVVVVALACSPVRVRATDLYLFP